jgi:hypothetical protein
LAAPYTEIITNHEEAVEAVRASEFAAFSESLL